MSSRKDLRLLILYMFCGGFLALTAATAFLAWPADARPAQFDQREKGAKIFVDPDVRVSYDGDVVHMEAYAAASATNPDLLVAGGELIVPGRGLNVSEARLYRSTDAGARWNPVLLPDEVNGGWDNAITGDVNAGAYFITSNWNRGLTLYRTDDGGETWASTILTAAAGWDRPHVVVDVTTSSYRGRFYVAGEADDGVRVMSSSDGGKTFSSPVTACPHRSGWNASTNASPVILSDGTLVVPCAPYPNDPERATWTDAEAGVVASSDGGRTFGSFHKVGIVHRMLNRDMYAARIRGDVLLSGNFMQGPSFAVAPSGAKFADRIYAAWQDVDSTGTAHIFSAWSADRGTTWSLPFPVDLSRAPDGKASMVQQGVPMVAVNREGVLGVAWFDNRLAGDRTGYDVYFTVSLDGGLTFLSPVRVSTATSRPARGLNLLPAFEVSKPSTDGSLAVRVTSPFSDRATGGDYSSMAVDAAGRFHPFWTDARNGTWQLYSANVRVLSADTVARLATPSVDRRQPTSGPSCMLDGSHIQLLISEPNWSGTGKELIVPVRLVNTSTNPIVDAITVRVTTDPSAEQWMSFVPDPGALTPGIFDVARDASGKDATFTYRPTAAAPLFPSSVTDSQDWHFRVPVPHFMNFSFKVEIRSLGCPSK